MNTMRQQRGEIKLRQETKIKRVQVNVNHIERKKNKKTKQNKTREKKQKLRNRKFFILMLTSGVISLNGRG